jgi:hypothetical protein
MSKTVGGRVEITIDGVAYHPVADVQLQESNIETEVVDNQDGTIGRTVKSSHYELDITFRFMDGLDIQQLMGRTFNFSMVEKDLGRSILMSNAFLSGKPRRNTTNGEISGLTLVSSQLTVR